VAWRWRSGVQSLAPRSPPQPVWQRHPCLISARGRRFGGLTSKCWGGLCGSSPSWRSRSALLRIAERWRCNRLAICEAEFVGHKVTSSRSSSSVQRDMADLGHGGPSAWCHACRFVWHHFGDCSLAASAKSEPLANQRAPDKLINASYRVPRFCPVGAGADTAGGEICWGVFSAATSSDSRFISARFDDTPS
jgi:hypothetical protein